MVVRIRLEMHIARLKEWGVSWGIYDTDLTNSKHYHMLEPQFRKYGDLAVQYVAVINQLIDDLRGTAKANTSLSHTAACVPLSAVNHIARLPELEASNSDGRSLVKQNIERIQQDASVIDRLKWGPMDEKATKSLKLIKDMIDELYLFFKPPQVGIAGPLVFNSSLASKDFDVLDKISDTCSDDPLFQGLAYLKAATSSLQSRKTVLDDVKVNMQLRQLKETQKPDARNWRGKGIIEGKEVLVEWKIETSLTSANKNSHLTSMVIEHRVKQIAKLLKFNLKPPELRTLDCLGVVSKSDPQSGAGSGKHTLLSVVSRQPEINIVPGQRFGLAIQIVESLLFLHIAGWLHKGIRSDNILFFGSSPSKIDLDKPYIAGFEYSREAAANKGTEGVTDDLEFNLYRHPLVQGVPIESSDQDLEEDNSGDGNAVQASTPAPPTAAKAKRTIPKTVKPPFAEIHDIYSLGVVLLEIGLLTSAIDMYETARDSEAYETHTAQNFSSWLIEKEVPKLSRTMGKRYRDAVENCLTGELTAVADNHDSTPTNSIGIGLYMNVLRPLAACHV
ncbi:MAG: hypothetical protein GOMPHAMPRED_005072 [Gomphillus americanus]|uniref:Prion-inhibition and propagation HeLo domain-containing protein n=1 Tax=Gomphillus americanus TaxID=1940652 RepID=A0A8H3IBD2_9LECA|nr:MAG: hypothetical protein GOMPHAMPRED_005072 [Gomphillus americanus]